MQLSIAARAVLHAAALGLGGVLAVLAVLALALAVWALVLRRRKPAPQLPADYHELQPSTSVYISSVAFYIFLVARAITLDLIDRALAALPWRRRAPDAAPEPVRRGPPLKSGLQDLYERRMYGRISDTFNRPITGEAGAEVTVLAREWSRTTGELELTGEQIRCINLGSYNYLGFGGCDEICTPEVLRVVSEHGTGTNSTRAEVGTSALHVEFEREIARFIGKEAAITLGMGFATNSTMIPTLVDADGDGRGVLVLSDALNHSSIIEGVRASGACVMPFVHNSMIDLEAKLRDARARGQPRSGAPWRKIIVIVEGIYSMEGEFCRLREVVALKDAYGAFLYLDEAHSIGAIGPTGRGVAELFGVPPSQIDVMMGTFTKSFGSVGGYIAASAAVIETLRARSQGALFASAMSLPAVQQVLSSVRVISQADGPGTKAAALGRAKLEALRENTAYFRRALVEMGCEVLGDDGSPVVPIMIYHPEKMALFSREMLSRGIAVVVVGYPATPLLLSRVRFCISAAHTRAQLDYALGAIRDACRRLRMFYAADASASAEQAARAAERADRLLHAPLELPNAAEIATSLPAWAPEPLADSRRRSGSAAPRSPPPPPPALLPPPAAVPQQPSMQLRALAASAAASAAAAAAAAVPSPTSSGASPRGSAAPSSVLAAHDPLGLRADRSLRDVATRTIEQYGVGTCGPRAFYGTLDLHLQLEAELAAFCRTEKAIVYSKGVATFSSVLPAFAKRADCVFVDSAAYAVPRVRTGIELSRARVRVYPTGDMGALRTLLEQVEAADARAPPAKVGRRFIVTEGVCSSSGEVAPLPRLSALRDRYGCYLFVDETHSFGVLGAKGRGLAEHWGLPASAVDAVVGSLEHALGSVGGFCAGSQQIVRQQRLFATGYIFSASLPAYCCAVASAALRILDAQPERAAAARARARVLRTELVGSGVVGSRALELSGGDANCVHVRAPAAGSDPAEQRAALERVAARAAREHGLQLVVAPVCPLAAAGPPPPPPGGGRPRADSATVAPPQPPLSPAASARARAAPAPSLRLTPTGALTDAELSAAVRALASALAAELRAARPAADAEARRAPEGVSLLKLPAAAAATAALPGAAAGAIAAAQRTAAEDVDAASDASANSAGSDADGTGGAAPKRGGGTAAARAAAAAAAARPSDVETPLSLALGFARRGAHAYLRGQAEWGSRALLPRIQASCASPLAKRLFGAMAVLGSEAFYVAAFPALIWAEAEAGTCAGADAGSAEVGADEGRAVHSALARTLVLFFSASVVVGNVLKVSVALPRPTHPRAGGEPAAAEALPPVDEGWNRDYAWPSISAMNSIALPFFVLRFHFGSTYLWNQTSPLTSVALYTAAFIWAAGICGSRLVAGAATPADVQGGMMIGAFLVRLSLPHHEALLSWLMAPDSTMLGGLSLEAGLPLAAAALLIVHPVTPDDPRGSYSVINSAKALGFSTAFALGTRARALAAATSVVAAAASAATRSAGACRAAAGLVAMAATLRATHGARRAITKRAHSALGVPGKAIACAVEYALLGALVSLWIPQALEHGANVMRAIDVLPYV